MPVAYLESSITISAEMNIAKVEKSTKRDLRRLVGSIKMKKGMSRIKYRWDGRLKEKTNNTKIIAITT
jgi:hypothetical protein